MQGRAAVHITEIKGSYSGIMGLPLCRPPGCCVAWASRSDRIWPHNMQQDILINWSPQETRVAVVEHGSLQELRSSGRWNVGWWETSILAK